MRKNIQIALIDDDSLIVQLLTDYLNKITNFEVSITANSGNVFIEKLKIEPTPDIVIIDLKMNDGNGLETIPTLTKSYPNLKIIALSSYYKPSFMGHLLKAGANAFLSKETDKEELVYIINEVVEKGHYFSAEQFTVLRDQISHKTIQTQLYKKEKLSPRELEVLKLICQQLTAREIADKLFVSTKTVEAHRSNLLLKTGVKNTAGLIIYAAQQQLINPNDFVILD